MSKCSDDFNPEFNGQECACVDCNPIGFCVDNHCYDCDGPVGKRCLQDEVVPHD